MSTPSSNRTLSGENLADSILRRSPIDAYTEVFRALSDPTRIQILSLIASSDDEYACTKLEGELPISKSTISYHVKILHGAGMVQVRKAGRNYFYTARRGVIDNLLPGFLEHLQAEDFTTV